MIELRYNKPIVLFFTNISLYSSCYSLHITEMSEIKYKNQILAAIDHLRSRKSRPDANRICKFMLKCYKVPPKDTKADLKRCLKEKSIFKVDYKDNVSYRNAAKWRKKSRTSNSKLYPNINKELQWLRCR